MAAPVRRGSHRLRQTARTAGRAVRVARPPRWQDPRPARPRTRRSRSSPLDVRRLRLSQLAFVAGAHDAVASPRGLRETAHTRATGAGRPPLGTAHRRISHQQPSQHSTTCALQPVAWKLPLIVGLQRLTRALTSPRTVYAFHLEQRSAPRPRARRTSQPSSNECLATLSIEEPDALCCEPGYPTRRPRRLARVAAARTRRHCDLFGGVSEALRDGGRFGHTRVIVAINLRDPSHDPPDRGTIAPTSGDLALLAELFQGGCRRGRRVLGADV